MAPWSSTQRVYAKYVAPDYGLDAEAWYVVTDNNPSARLVAPEVLPEALDAEVERAMHDTRFKKILLRPTLGTRLCDRLFSFLTGAIYGGGLPHKNVERSYSVKKAKRLVQS